MIELRIESKLREQGETFSWLAAQTGINRRLLSKLQNGRVATLRLDVLERLCRALECKPGDLLALLPDEEPTSPGRTNGERQTLEAVPDAQPADFQKVPRKKAKKAVK